MCQHSEITSSTKTNDMCWSNRTLAFAISHVRYRVVYAAPAGQIDPYPGRSFGEPRRISCLRQREATGEAYHTAIAEV